MLQQKRELKERKIRVLTLSSHCMQWTLLQKIFPSWFALLAMVRSLIDWKLYNVSEQAF